MRQARSTMLLVSGAAAVYAPQPLGTTNLLAAGGQVVALLDDRQAAALRNLFSDLQIVNAHGCVVVPGLVDMHSHITGGGGEAGPASRCPEARLSELLDAGITTVVGVIGTDTVTRSQDNLLAKCRALNEEGVTALAWCGGYRFPPPTITGDVQRELLVVRECIGVGELAVSDHRGGAPSPRELARLALDARVGGMLSGKCGLTYCHMGDGELGLQPLDDAIETSGNTLTRSQFLPTHMARSERLAHKALQWIRGGGFADFTADKEARDALVNIEAAGLPLASCTVSSDAFGSYPEFDAHGKLIKYKVGKPGTLLELLRGLVSEDGWPLEQALPLLTSNVATILKLRGKGVVRVGGDADLLVLSSDDLELRYVVAKGELVRTPEWTRGGFFEEGGRIRPYVPPED